MNATNQYLAGVLTVIAAGVLMIAYALVFPRPTSMQVFGPQAPMGVAARDAWGHPLPVRVAMPQAGYGRSDSRAYVVAGEGDDRWVTRDEPTIVRPTRTVRTVVVDEPVRTSRRVTRVVERPRRDWKKAAMIIGGTTATGAGIGGIVGGKKGALVGAAIGGGASTIYEMTKDR